MLFLKQSTAVTVVLGPFLDSTDAITAETALTISQADVRLSKNAAAFAQVGEATSATHMENGYYSKPLSTTDTGTLGILTVAVAESGALPVWHEYMVVPANVWDSLFGADLLQVDTTQHLGSTPNALVSGRYDASAGALAAAVITAAAIAADAITDAKVASDVTIASVTGAVGSVTGAVGSVTGAVGSVTGAVGSVTGNVGGNVTGSVGSVATGGITAASFAADAITAAKVAADVGTEIAAAVRTDQATELGRIDAAITTRATPAQVATELGTYDAPTFTELDARTDAIDAALVTLAADVDTEVASILAMLSGLIMAQGTIGATGNTATTVHMPSLAHGGDTINDNLLVIQDVSTGLYYSRWITDWSSSADLAVIGPSLDFTLENSVDKFWLLSLRRDTDRSVLAQGSVGPTGNTTSVVHLDGDELFGDDELNYHLLRILDVSTNEYHSRWIADWANTGLLATLSGPALPFTPEVDDKYWVFAIRHDVNVKQVNDVALVGDGDATPWGPA